MPSEQVTRAGCGKLDQNGSKIETGKCLKSVMLRVTTVISRAKAIAAIWASQMTCGLIYRRIGFVGLASRPGRMVIAMRTVRKAVAAATQPARSSEAAS